MQTNDAGLLCQSGGTGGTWGYTGTDGTVCLPVLFNAPSAGDVGVLLGDVFLPVVKDAPVAGQTHILVDVPAEPTKQFCIAVETPAVLPYLQSGTSYYTLLDSPLETDDDFDTDLKSQDGYVKNTTGLTFYSVTEDEYDDPEVINYIYSTTSQYPYPAMRTLNAQNYSSATAPCMIEQTAGYPAPNPTATASPVEASGTVWDRKPLIPEYSGNGSYQSLYVRAYAEGRIVSNVKSVNFRVLPGRLTVEYDAGSKELKVTCPGTVQPASGFYLLNLGVAYIFQSQSLANAKATLTASGTYQIFWYGMYYYGVTSYMSYPLFNQTITIDGDEPTESFTKTVWLPIPTSWQPAEHALEKVAVTFSKELTADYYISPGGSGDGLSKESPGSWASVLGVMSASNGTLTAGAIGTSGVVKTVRATTGTYSAGDGMLLYVPSSVTVIGGHSADFTQITGKSTLGSDPRMDGTLENFRIQLYNSANGTSVNSAGTTTTYYARWGNLRGCEISCSDSSVSAALREDGYYDYSYKSTSFGNRGTLENCTIRFSGYYAAFYADLVNCDFEFNGSGEIQLPATDTLYSEEWDDSTHSYNTTNTQVLRVMVVYSACYIYTSRVVNSRIVIDGVFNGLVSYNGDSDALQLKNSYVEINCAAQSGGIVRSGETKDALVELAKSGETRGDGSYFDLWVEGATADGHDYHDNPEWAYVDERCYHYTSANRAEYNMSSVTAKCGFSVAVDSTVKINCPGTPSGGSGGAGDYYEATYPSYTTWEWYETGEWYREYDEEGNLIYEYPIGDYREVTIPAHPYNFWQRGADGQSACDITVTIPKNLRNCKVTVVTGSAGNGGNGGSGYDTPLVVGDHFEFGRAWLWYDWERMPSFQGAGFPGIGGRVYLNGPVRWTADCEFHISLGQCGLSGSNNVFPSPIRSNVPGSMAHKDGMDYIAIPEIINYWGTWSGSPGKVFYDPGDCNDPTSAWYGGKGGAPQNANSAGGTGGNGIPVEGYREAGAGGGTASAGVRLGDYWE